MGEGVLLGHQVIFIDKFQYFPHVGWGYLHIYGEYLLF